MLTPVGVLFGTSYLHHVSWAARGYADPLGAIAFLGGLVLLVGPSGARFDRRRTPAFWAALLMALATMIRPNLAPAVGVLLGGAGLAALASHDFGRLAALCLGFSAILLTGLHNWYFGGVLVPLSSEHACAERAADDAISTILPTLKELARLELGGPHIARAVDQIATLLSGPSGLPLRSRCMCWRAQFCVRVVLSRRFEPMLRLVALAAIALTPIGLIYFVAVRYNLVMWFLMATRRDRLDQDRGIGAAFDSWRPGWREGCVNLPSRSDWRRQPARSRAFLGIDTVAVHAPITCENRSLLNRCYPAETNIVSLDARAMRDDGLDV